MGIVHCSNVITSDTWKTIEFGLDNKNSPLEKRIYDEYISLKESLKDRNNQSVSSKIFILTTTKKQFTRFIKWYKIAYYDNSKKENNYKSPFKKILPFKSSYSNTSLNNNSSNKYQSNKHCNKNLLSSLKKTGSPEIKSKKLILIENSIKDKENHSNKSLNTYSGNENNRIGGQGNNMNFPKSLNITQNSQISYKSRESSWILNREIELNIKSNFKNKNSLLHNLKMENQNQDPLKKTIRKNLYDFSLNQYNKFLEKVCKGPPVSMRWIVWIILAKLPEEISGSNYISYLIDNIDINIDIQIKKDIHRTLFDEAQFTVEDRHNMLYKLLRAFACNDQEVGYCQGMNFIAGFLLVVSNFNEIESFYMMMALFSDTFSNHLGIRGFYTERFPLLYFYLNLFDYYFNENLPALYMHFKSLDIPNEAWISKWIQTLYTICLPIKVTMRVWDCTLSYGLNFLIKFSISLLKFLESKLMAISDSFDMVDFLKIMTPYSCIDTDILLNLDEILNNAIKLNITEKMVMKLKSEYEIKQKINLSYLNVHYEIRNLDNISMKSNSKIDFNHSEYSNTSGQLKENSNISLDNMNKNFSIVEEIKKQEEKIFLERINSDLSALPEELNEHSLDFDCDISNKISNYNFDFNEHESSKKILSTKNSFKKPLKDIFKSPMRQNCLMNNKLSHKNFLQNDDNTVCLTEEVDKSTIKLSMKNFRANK